MARYFTRESVQEGVDAINNDPEHLKKAELLTGKMSLRVYDDPDGNDLLVTYTFEKGRCTDWIYEAEPAPSSLRNRPFVPMKDGVARVTANYQTFVKLDKEEMEPADTLDSPDYKIEGSMLMIMPLMQAVDSWNRTVRKIPKEY
jgi:hypothetical protein